MVTPEDAPPPASRCIYPGPHGGMSDEHYLPRALGRFAGFEPLRGQVCRCCNAMIGRCEEQFLRVGHVGTLRWHLGMQGRDGPPPSPYERGAAGAPPVRATAQVVGIPYPVLLESEFGTDRAEAMSQIVFFDDRASAWIQLPLQRYLAAADGHEQLLAELRSRQIPTGTSLQIRATDEEQPAVADLCRRAGLIPPAEWTPLEEMPQTVQAVGEIRGTDATFRAIAKMAFHYALIFLPGVHGSEGQFDAIRNFIWSGGDWGPLVRHTTDPPIANYNPRGRAHWTHVLGAGHDDAGISGIVGLFYGRGFPGLFFHVRLSTQRRLLWQPPDHVLHEFVIEDPTADGGPVGIVRAVDQPRLIQPVFAPRRPPLPPR